MTVTATPPRWAEALLHLSLQRRDFESVSGDLLEEYRDTQLARGRRRADLWYVRQVLGFVFRGARLWAAMFSAVFVARTALDSFSQPADFHTRSTVSTAAGISILVAAGLWAARRSGSFVAGAVEGLAATSIAALVSICSTACLLAVWHDPKTLAAIRDSGGLSEVFTLPIMMVLPGIVFGAIGGGVGAGIRRLHRA
ncbi:MAG: permease prefix domain 2-containing transporter [Acidobacteriota bacterium]|nr:permease prefix domain 2-containing transporter [Acidobacteriota bacterium]